MLPLPSKITAVFAFGSSELRSPPHVDPSEFAWLREIVRAKKPASRDVKYCSEAPWRDGTTDAAIIDPVVILDEEGREKAAEAAEDEDNAAGFDTEALRDRGVRVD